MEDVGKFLGGFGLVFPDDEDFPAEPAKDEEIAFISLGVALSFCLPEVGVGFGFDLAVTAVVHVPETGVSKLFRKDL